MDEVSNAAVKGAREIYDEYIRVGLKDSQAFKGATKFSLAKSLIDIDICTIVVLKRGQRQRKDSFSNACFRL